jgi:hypothetical protein
LLVGVNGMKCAFMSYGCSAKIFVQKD